MHLDFLFFFNNILLGAGLAMDAFSVSLANGLSEPRMKKGKMCAVAGTFGIFQAIMPLIGWYCVHCIIKYFKMFEPFIPWIALSLLAYIGGKMVIDGIKVELEEEKTGVGLWALLVQGVATSIDALSVGFTISEYDVREALLAVSIIAAVTFAICLGGLVIGKKFGTKLSHKASIFGGIILIVIGFEIFIMGII